MRIILSASNEEAISLVANMLIDRIESRPNSVLGLATGRTMEPVYRRCALILKQKSLRPGNAFFFMLDEYVGLRDGHPSSFKTYVREHVLVPWGVRDDQIAFPPSTVSNASAYESLLKESGGIDLQLLGVGTNGHIGFNEPGSTKDSRTRLVELTSETRAANKNQFAEGSTPEQAISMGIGTILEAKSLVLLATGKSKADAIKFLMNHHDDSRCPVTFLKSHPDFTLVLDPEAASKINLKM
jgi:glucosamine-6-phosphate deaminase